MENRIGPALNEWCRRVRGEEIAWYANPLKQAKNSELIHEMLERGYAVMKVPESGTPDALK